MYQLVFSATGFFFQTKTYHIDSIQFTLKYLIFWCLNIYINNQIKHPLPVICTIFISQMTILTKKNPFSFITISFVLYFSANRSMTRKQGLSGVSNNTLGQSKANKRASKKMYFQENMEKMDCYQGKSITESQFCSPESVYQRLYYQKNKHKINSQRRALYRKKQAQSRFLECPVVRKSQRQSTLPKFQGKVAVNAFKEK